MVGGRAWIDGVLVVDAAADSEAFDDLITHDGECKRSRGKKW